MECYETNGAVLLRDGEHTAVYFFESMDLALVSVPVIEPLEEFARKLHRGALRDARSKEAPHHGDRGGMLPLFVDAPAKTRPASRIGRLTINISNACNLWCSYCYANHGLYHSPESLMPAERAAAIVERVLEYYSDVESVQFFGGEPLLNLPAIDATGRAFDAAVKCGQLKRRPSMMATTNGTLSSPRVMETLKRWQMSLMVSWDGPQPIHDAVRPTQRGGSSFSAVSRTIERLQVAGIPFDVECTYNAQHLDAGFSVVDLMEYFYATAGLEQVHIPPVSLPRPLDPLVATNEDRQRIFRGPEFRVQQDKFLSLENLAPLYRDAARRTVDNVFRSNGPTLLTAVNIIEKLATKNRTSEYCPAFFRQISVAADGSVYPCFMFIGDPSFNMGNLLKEAFPSERSVTVINRYFKEFGTESSGTCRWYGTLFGGCIASEYVTSSTLAFRDEGVRLAMIEECLLGVARNGRRFLGHASATSSVSSSSG